jgi:hypothetical protein
MKAAGRMLAVAITALGALLSARGEVVDRIVAVVDQTLLGVPAAAGQIITWSAAYEEARYQAFQAGAEPPQWSPGAPDEAAQLRDMLARMVDQLLLEQALDHSPLTLTGEQDVAGRIQEIQGRFSDSERFRRELARYGLSQAALEERLRRENRLLEFVDFTLRPDVRITPAQVEGYYQSELLPRLEGAARGAGPAAMLPTLEEVQEQIREILTQQEIDRRLEQWLQQLRRSARIALRLQ